MLTLAFRYNPWGGLTSGGLNDNVIYYQDSKYNTIYDTMLKIAYYSPPLQAARPTPVKSVLCISVFALAPWAFPLLTALSMRCRYICLAPRGFS